MILKTRIFELSDGKYASLAELAQNMEISVSQIYRVRQGKRNINQKFLLGAIRAFPKHKLDDLFYFVPELPAVTPNYHHAASAGYAANGQTAKKHQR